MVTLWSREISFLGTGAHQPSQQPCCGRRCWLRIDGRDLPPRHGLDGPGYGTSTPLGAYLTIGSPTGDLPASVHEALARSYPANPGNGVQPAAEDGIFTDHGPSDTSTMADIYFPASELTFGESISFVQFYGVRPSEQEALDDLKAVGADLWSLGQAEIDPTDGKPNTFIWGYKELQIPRP